MRLFNNFKYKLLISVLIGCLSSLYQMETKDELAVCEKKVMLSKPRLDVYEFLSNLENYPAWFPNMISAKALESQKQLSVGQRYQLVNTYLFGIGETTTQATILGVQKPVMFEYINDNFLMERIRLEFNSSDKNRTIVNWSVFSRRKSLLFKITVGPLYQFYYSQILREGLFSLQFLMKK